MSNKKKIKIFSIVILSASLFIAIIIMIDKINDKLYEIEMTPVFVDEETEFIVKNLVAIEYEEFNKVTVTRVDTQIEAFGGHGMLKTNEEGKYYIQPSEFFPDAVYMDEEFLELQVWLFKMYKGITLTVEDVEEYIYKGNKEKKEEINAYVTWCISEGEEKQKAYAYMYDGDWDALTLEEQQDYIISLNPSWEK